MSAPITAIVIDPDGTMSEADITDPDTQYPVLSKAVGGLIEMVSIDKAHGHIYVNEEGKLGLGMAANVPAQRAAEAMGLRLIPGDWLAGPVVFSSLGTMGLDAGTTPAAREVITQVLAAR